MNNNATWFIMMPASFIIVSVLMTCLCWRKKRQKSDWVGLDGMVTQTNPDENVNHLPSVTVQCVPDKLPTNNTDLRIVAPNTTRRSLPDIPLEGPLQTQSVVYDVNGDNSSEIYATVEPYAGKKMVNGIDNRPSISQHSSISQADDPYARVNYEKLRKSEKMEHPYARVQSSTKEMEDENSSDGTTPRTSMQPTTSQNNEPVPPPRSNRASDQSITIDITAATAVAGAIPANQELPYMTPPIAQTNFSGDSQDSSKGYTSISVREPLANIRAQTKELKKPLRDLDPHYSTVSDDSDEVYTTIHDPNSQLYTSGSETYAQIQPLTVAAEINPVPQEAEERAEETDSAPQPPSVDSLKNVAHSRQASSSSSVANVGSPKPEKRQANSPLPPPPSKSPDLYLNSEKLTAKNLDDMYAKVQKNRKKNNDDEAAVPTTSAKKSIVENGSNSLLVTSSAKDHSYETLKKSSDRCSDPGYERLKSKDDECNSEPGYASINGPDSLINSDPGYEVLKQRSLPPSESDPNYEELNHDVGYSKINESSGSTASDGYSTINKQRKADDKSRTSSSFDSSEPKDFGVDEPNYESMPSEISASDGNYTALKSTTTTGSESDPNYESVNHGDYNYESVKYSEPPYEQLNDNGSSKDGAEDVGYETINKEEPPYQKIKGDDDDVATSIKGGKRNVEDSDEDIVIQV